MNTGHIVCYTQGRGGLETKAKGIYIVHVRAWGGRYLSTGPSQKKDEERAAAEAAGKK